MVLKLVKNIPLSLTPQQVATVLQALMEVPASYKVVAPVIDEINKQVKAATAATKVKPDVP